MRHLSQRNEIKILVLVKPKISRESAAKVCHNLGFDGVFCKEAEGRSGGIWLLWHTSYCRVSILAHSPCYIHVKVTQNDGFDWFLIAVYRNPNGEHGIFVGTKLIYLSLVLRVRGFGWAISTLSPLLRSAAEGLGLRLLEKIL